jgi:aryl-alcohol dehydrogenase-like predicted oxidoreductase
LKPKHTTELGSTRITVPRIGTGTNRWVIGENDVPVYEVYTTLIDMGINFFDTAEIYTGGRSERLLGECRRRDGRPAVLASKYRPSEDRSTSKAFMQALDATLNRIGVETIDLYYIHTPPTTGSIETLMDCMAEAHQSGKIRAVGVSNFSAEQMRRATSQLEKHDIPLAANQVEYSFSNREPENDGVLEACRELRVSLVAYRPLSRGILASPKVHNEKNRVDEALAIIADRHGGTPSEVALAWLLSRDDLIIPIPGATKKEHALQNADALNLAIRDDEWAVLDEAS